MGGRSSTQGLTGDLHIRYQTQRFEVEDLEVAKLRKKDKISPCACFLRKNPNLATLKETYDVYIYIFFFSFSNFSEKLKHF